jgi:hypothetical protein
LTIRPPLATGQGAYHSAPPALPNSDGNHERIIQQCPPPAPLWVSCAQFHLARLGKKNISPRDFIALPQLVKHYPRRQDNLIYFVII